MKLKTLLKFGFPIIMGAGLAVSLPLALTSCSDSKNEETKVETLTPANDKIAVENLNTIPEVKVEIPENIANQEGISYNWQYRQKQDADQKSIVALANDNEWKDLGIHTETLKNIDPVFLWNGSLEDNELRLQVKNQDGKTIAESTEISFKMPDGFKPANVVETSMANINGMRQLWPTILKTYQSDFSANSEKLASDGGWTITKDPQTMQQDGNTSLFDALSKVLNANFDNENQIQSITLKSHSKSILVTDANANPLSNISATIKLTNLDNENSMDLSNNNLWSSSLYLNQPNNDDSFSFTDSEELVIENLVPIFNTLNLTANPDAVPEEGAESTFKVTASYLDGFKDEIGFENDKKYNVSFTLYKLVQGEPEQVSVVGSQSTITEYEFSPIEVKPNERYRVVGRINETESGALVSVLAADTTIKTQPEETSEDVATTNEQVTALMADKTNVWNSTLLVSGNFEGTAIKTGSDLFNKITSELGLTTARANQVKSITVAGDNTPGTLTLKTVSIELEEGFNWSEELQSAATSSSDAYSISGQTLTMNNIVTGVTIPESELEEGEDQEQVSQKQQVTSSFFQVFRR